MKFILVRHTTTDWNLQKRCQGRIDIELNEQGIKQAEEVAKQLLNLGITKIASSDLKRAKQTAEIINKELNLELILEPGLRECDFGEIGGMTKEQAIEKYKDISFIDYKDYDFKFAGGEDYKQVLRRYTDVFKKYSKTNGIMLIVAHGRGFNTFLYSIGQEPNLKRGEYRIIEYE